MTLVLHANDSTAKRGMPKHNGQQSESDHRLMQDNQAAFWLTHRQYKQIKYQYFTIKGVESEINAHIISKYNTVLTNKNGIGI